MSLIYFCFFLLKVWSAYGTSDWKWFPKQYNVVRKQFYAVIMISRRPHYILSSGIVADMNFIDSHRVKIDRWWFSISVGYTSMWVIIFSFLLSIIENTSFIVQLDNSNESQVTLRDVDFGLSGEFSCEVTADAPTFSTSSSSKNLTVVCKYDV